MNKEPPTHAGEFAGQIYQQHIEVPKPLDQNDKIGSLVKMVPGWILWQWDHNRVWREVARG